MAGLFLLKLKISCKTPATLYEKIDSAAIGYWLAAALNFWLQFASRLSRIFERWYSTSIYPIISRVMQIGQGSPSVPTLKSVRIA
jgi:hypothetical protein